MSTAQKTLPAAITSIPLSMWMQAGIITLGAFCTMLSATLLSAALPTIASNLGVSEAAIQWLASAYLMALAAGVPVSAWASRRLGPTQLWLAGLALFAAFSALCALAPSYELLLFARIGQGLAGGLLVPAGQTVVGMVVGRERLGRVVGTIGVAIVLAPVLGTSLGAMLLGSAGWQSLFWVNVPLSILALIAGFYGLPRPVVAAKGPQRLDWLGLFLILCSLPLLMEGMKAMGATASGDQWHWVALGIGALFAVLFVYRSLRVDSPLLHLRLFKQRSFALSALLMFLGGAINFGAQFLLPLYFRDIRHESLAAVGLLLTPQLLGTAIGFPVAGYLSDKLGPRWGLIAGGLITALGTVPLALMTAEGNYTVFGIAIAARGFGLALATVPAMAAGMAMAGPAHLADAAPILNILQRMGAVAGTAFVSAIYAALAWSSHDDLAGFQYANWVLTAGAMLIAVAATFIGKEAGPSKRQA